MLEGKYPSVVELGLIPCIYAPNPPHNKGLELLHLLLLQVLMAAEGLWDERGCGMRDEGGGRKEWCDKGSHALC